MREKEEAKKVTANNTFTRKVHIQLNQSEAFDRCINSVKSLFSSNTDEERFIQLIQKSSDTTKNAFVHIGVKLAKLPNQRRDTVAREITRTLR